MSSPHHSKAHLWALPIFMTPALLVRCGGTEADNPVTEVVVTACKSEQDEYDPTQVETFLSAARGSQTAAAGSADAEKSLELLSTDGLRPITGGLRQALTRTADIPRGLSCVEWQLTGTTLDVQIVNFRSGCGVEWQGKATEQGDRVTLLLNNVMCNIAGCGNCLYDTASVIELSSSRDITLALSLDKRCDGQPEVYEWPLPLAEQPRGIFCGYARMEGLGTNVGQPFTFCAQGANACLEEGLACVDVGEPVGEHCLPTCTADTDCPVSGGTRCVDNHCVASVRENFF